jgi:hypothetical protein
VGDRLCKITPRSFLQEWNSNLENSPKALNYRHYKQIFEFENYFNILENKDIFTFCKFRTNNTKLPIETGRWNNIARENRKCQLCQENQIGDEFHFIAIISMTKENHTLKNGT